MTDTNSATQALLGKLLKAAQDSGYVRKNKEHGQGYKYADDEAITDKVREATLAQGVLVYPEELEFALPPHVIEDPNGKAPTVLVSIRGHLAATDGSAAIRVASLGQGIDKGDKAIYKAMTGFKKYGYRHLVMMATGDDPEQTRDDERAERPYRGKKADEPKVGAAENTAPQPDKPATKETRDQIVNLADSLGVSKAELTTLRKAVTDKTSAAQFTNADVGAMLQAVKEAAAAKNATGGEIVS